MINNCRDMTGYYTCKSRQFLIKESLVALENNTQKNMIIEIKVLVSKPNKGFPGRSVVKNLPANAGDVSSIPGLGRYPTLAGGFFTTSTTWEALKGP